MRILCIKIGNVFSYYFHINPWVEASAGGLLVKYEYELNCQEKSKFDEFITNEGLSLSGIALSFDGFGSILWHSVWF
jgi:hypothetical protein